MKLLLIISAVFEAATGIALLVAPSSAVLRLLGSPFDSPAALIIGRVLGAALFSLGAACWFARNDGRGRAAIGLIAAMLVYNFAVVSLVGYARFDLGISGDGMLPAAIMHSALFVWCVACLRVARRNASASRDSHEAMTEKI